VRRAQKEGLAFSVLDNPDVFLQFYNGFAATKDMEAMDAKILRAYWPHLAVTQMTNAAEVLVMHCYIMDKGIGRGTLWHSASQFRGADGEDAQQRRNLIGRANRLLHFRDMTWLRDQGFKTYDFGGYAANTTDPALQHINEFKDSFGGELVEESNYASAASTLLRALKSPSSGPVESPKSAPWSQPARLRGRAHRRISRTRPRCSRRSRPSSTRSGRKSPASPCWTSGSAPAAPRRTCWS
jgi:hypothetical protein